MAASPSPIRGSIVVSGGGAAAGRTAPTAAAAGAPAAATLVGVAAVDGISHDILPSTSCQRACASNSVMSAADHPPPSPESSAEPSARAHCDGAAQQGGILLRCADCGSVGYCGSKCRGAGWAAHWPACAAAAAAAPVQTAAPLAAAPPAKWEALQRLPERTAAAAVFVCAVVVYVRNLTGEECYDDGLVLGNPVVVGTAPLRDAWTTDYWCAAAAAVAGTIPSLPPRHSLPLARSLSRAGAGT